jgi:tetratricopeptide (TPR) repeat protein
MALLLLIFAANTLRAQQTVPDGARVASIEDAILRVDAIRENPQSADPSELRELGALLRLARRYDAALVTLQELYSRTGDLEDLYRLAEMQIQLGAYGAAEKSAGSIVREIPGNDTRQYELRRRAYALLARALFYSGSAERSERLLSTLAELDSPELVEPATLLLLADVQRHLGKETTALDQLRRLHPSSIALLLDADGPVMEALVPSTLAIRTHAGSARLNAPVAEPPQEQPAIRGIQVGSFSDPDNAHHMVRDIEELGLSAEIAQQEREGRSIQIVLALVADGEPGTAQAVLSTLREAGFDGFLLY